MISRIINIGLIAIFAILVILFAYKELGKNDVTSLVVKEGQMDKMQTLSREEIENIIGDYISEHPEAIIASIEKLQQKKSQDQANEANEYLDKNFEQLVTQDNPPTIGNPDGDIKIVLLYDYRCSYCKKAHQIEKELLKQDPNVQIILRPIPVLGEKSLNMIKLALAVYNHSKETFNDFHNELMNMKGYDEKAISDLLVKYKLDEATIKNEMNSYAMQKLISSNLEFARKLGVRGTPCYIINGQIIPGFLPLEKLKQVIIYLRAQE